MKKTAGKLNLEKLLANLSLDDNKPKRSKALAESLQLCSQHWDDPSSSGNDPIWLQLSLKVCQKYNTIETRDYDEEKGASEEFLGSLELVNQCLTMLAERCGSLSTEQIDDYVSKFRELADCWQDDADEPAEEKVKIEDENVAFLKLKPTILDLFDQAETAAKLREILNADLKEAQQTKQTKVPMTQELNIAIQLFQCRVNLNSLTPVDAVDLQKHAIPTMGIFMNMIDLLHRSQQNPEIWQLKWQILRLTQEILNLFTSKHGVELLPIQMEIYFQLAITYLRGNLHNSNFHSTIDMIINFKILDLKFFIWELVYLCNISDLCRAKGIIEVMARLSARIILNFQNKWPIFIGNKNPIPTLAQANSIYFLVLENISSTMDFFLQQSQVELTKKLISESNILINALGNFSPTTMNCVNGLTKIATFIGKHAQLLLKNEVIMNFLLALIAGLSTQKNNPQIFGALIAIESAKKTMTPSKPKTKPESKTVPKPTCPTPKKAPDIIEKKAEPTKKSIEKSGLLKPLFTAKPPTLTPMSAIPNFVIVERDYPQPCREKEKKHVKSLRKQGRLWRGERDQLAIELKSTTSKLSNSQQQVNQFRKQLKGFTDQEQKITELTIADSAKALTIRSLEEQRDTAHDQIRNLHTAFSSKRNEFSEELKQANTQITQLSQENERLSKLLSATQRELQSTLFACAKIKETAEAERRAILMRERSFLQNEASYLEEIDQLKSEIKGLKSKLAQSQATAVPALTWERVGFAYQPHVAIVTDSSGQPQQLLQGYYLI